MNVTVISLLFLAAATASTVYPDNSSTACKSLATAMNYCGPNGTYEIIVSPGVYKGLFIFGGKHITLTSTDPMDPDVVASTILTGAGISRVIDFAAPLTGDPAVLTGFTIRDGHAASGGGIAGNGSANCVVSRCVVKENTAESGGGGIYNVGGLICRNVIQNNTAESWRGGGLLECNGTITENIISGNSSDQLDTKPWSTGFGGGIADSRGVVRNNLIIGNDAGTAGGGVFTVAGDTTLDNNTVVGNMAGSYGGGVGHVMGGATIIRNCILWNNTATTGPDLYNVSYVTTSMVGENPILDAEYKPLAGSPCIDAGTYADWMDNATDLAGNARIINGTVDIGAYEYKP